MMMVMPTSKMIVTNEKLRLKKNFQTKTAETRSPRPPASLKYCAVE